MHISREKLRSLGRRAIKPAVILLCLVLVGVLYSHYLSGTIPLDSSLYNIDNLLQIKDNWEKLVESGLFVEHDYSTPETPILWYANPTMTNNLPDFTFYIIVYHTPYTRPGMSWNTYYERKGLIDVIYSGEKFGECRSSFLIESNICDIYGLFWDSSGTSKELDDIMRQALNATAS